MGRAPGREGLRGLAADGGTGTGAFTGIGDGVRAELCRFRMLRGAPGTDVPPSGACRQPITWSTHHSTKVHSMGRSDAAWGAVMQQHSTDGASSLGARQSAGELAACHSCEVQAGGGALMSTGSVGQVPPE